MDNLKPEDNKFTFVTFILLWIIVIACILTPNTHTPNRNSMKNARKTSILAIFALISSFLPAQNLVPNPSFEENPEIPCSCTNSLTDLQRYSKYWYAPSSGTCDIMSTKAKKGCFANVNDNYYGHQQPRTGDGMAMIISYSSGHGWREYLGVPLSKPLVKGGRYYAEFYVSRGDYTNVAISDLGMAFFTTEKPTTLTGYDIIATPAIRSASAIHDTAKWVKISGSFTAAEAYTHLVIGVFAANPTEELARGGRPNTMKYAAYYVDDVSVIGGEDITVKGDTLVENGTIASLLAHGSNSYSWVDEVHPTVVLSRTADYKPTMRGKKTFIVTGENGGQARITVNIIDHSPVYMQSLNGRKVKKGRTIEVHNETIKITVFDNNKIDGDSISLYYGDSCIVQNLNLTGKKKTFTIKLDKAHPQQLILFAINQGTIPPNTASVVIGDGRNSVNVVLSSDMKSCDSVMLVYKEQ
jgi:hypothetical protein